MKDKLLTYGYVILVGFVVGHLIISGINYIVTHYCDYVL